MDPRNKTESLVEAELDEFEYIDDYEDIGYLKNLEWLDLGENELTGSIVA